MVLDLRLKNNMAVVMTAILFFVVLAEARESRYVISEKVYFLALEISEKVYFLPPKNTEKVYFYLSNICKSAILHKLRNQ